VLIMTSSPQPTLNQVIDLAKAAGEIVRAGFDNKHTIGYKSAVDVVTESDKNSEAYILKQIRANFPQHAILTEESGAHAGESEHLWIIDPLDGTVNYSHHLPIYSISIAYQLQGQLQLGVVYDPTHDECFSAEKGAGAWLNGQPIHAADTAELIDSLLVTGFPYDLLSSEMHNIDYFGYFSRRSQGVRRLGSAALDLCYVAAGRLDGYWELSIKNWDIAAGTLIAREAGAVVSKIDGEADMLKPPLTIIAATPAIYPRLLEVLQKDISKLI